MAQVTLAIVMAFGFYPRGIWLVNIPRPSVLALVALAGSTQHYCDRMCPIYPHRLSPPQYSKMAQVEI
jgi:hypothetical protein